MKIFPSFLLMALFCLKTSAETPDGRFGGYVTLLNRQIHYFGGAVGTKDDQNVKGSGDLYILDISKAIAPISGANSLWELAKNTGDLKPDGRFFFAMAVMPSENTIMVYGGDSSGVEMQNPAIMYDSSTLRWKTYENPLPNLKQMAMGTMTRGAENKAYFFGGRSALANSQVFPPFNNIMHIYDFVAGTWSDGAALPNGVPIRYLSSVSVMGGCIYYIGGMTANYSTTAIIQDDILVPLSEILIYNYTSNTWRTEIAAGDAPSDRILFSVSSMPDSNEFLLYGGQTNRQSGQPIEEDACYLFNFRTMTWTKKELKGADIGPGPLYGHSAVFPGGSRLLFIMFGVNRDGQVSNRISLLDTNTYEWVEKYSSPYPGGNDTVITGGKNPDTTSPTDASGPSEGSSKGVIAGAVVGCVAGVGIIGALLFLCIRKRQSKKQRANNLAGKSGDLSPEARALQSMAPLHADEDLPHTYGKEHFYSDQPVTTNSSAYTSAKNDKQLSNTFKPYNQDSIALSPIKMTPEKPDGASTIHKNNNIRPIKPDGA